MTTQLGSEASFEEPVRSSDLGALHPGTGDGAEPVVREMQRHILIVDDEKLLCDSLGRYFQRKGYVVSRAYLGEEGIQRAIADRPDVVLLDLRLPDMSGIDALERIKAECPSTGVIMFTAHGDVPTAVAAMQNRADNFVLKPVHTDALLALVERTVEAYRRRDALDYLRERLARFRGGSRAGRLILPPEVVRTVELLAENSTTSALILGETGTGKGMVANLIHQLSDRRDHELVDINCAGLNSSLLESELFGHEKGAFTDAKSTKRGLLEVADKGSLFLDEVRELTPSVQARLLKVIEDRCFRRVGGTQYLRVDVRIMAATNADLEREAKAGRFRNDLFYRLNVIPLRLPPLRKRREDIAALTDLFVREFSETFGRDVSGCAPEAEAMLSLYAWPGNIRELRNVIERAVLLCDRGPILPAHLPDNLHTGARVAGTVAGEDRSLDTLEARHIRQVLGECNGNRSRAAAVLGIHRATLLNKIKKYGLDLE